MSSKLLKSFTKGYVIVAIVALLYFVAEGLMSNQELFYRDIWICLGILLFTTILVTILESLRSIMAKLESTERTNKN